MKLYVLRRPRPINLVILGDDLCGVSLSIRFNANLITIWNRNGANQKTIDGILAVVLEKIDPSLKPKEGSYYYKKHSEHAGYSDVVGKAGDEEQNRKKIAAWNEFGKIEEAKVKAAELHKALLEEAEADQAAEAEN